MGRPCNHKKFPSVIQMMETFGRSNNISYAKLAAGALRARNFSQLKHIKDTFGSQQMYRDPLTYLKNAQFLALFSKCELIASENAEQTAFKTFHSSCARMTYVNNAISMGHLTRDTHFILSKAYRFIGENYSFWDDHRLSSDIVVNGKHGPGATLDVSGKRTSREYKTRSCEVSGTNLAAHMRMFDRGFIRHDDISTNISVKHYNEGTFVPKNYLTHRFISIEPTLSVYYQLGLGNVLRRALLATGIDLSQGQSMNRWLARHGSISGEYATIDISSASDSISIQLVKSLFSTSSPALYRALCELRSPVTYITTGGKEYTVLLPMFSTMGNGFTFPLETIIFQSLIEGCMAEYGVKLPYLVYGDDLIVHKSIYYPLCNVLAELGMSPNAEKSFCAGPFRESCGSDWWEGSPVRPVHFRSTDQLSRYAFFNQLQLIPNGITDDLCDLLEPFFNLKGPRVMLPTGNGRRCIDGMNEYFMPGWAWTEDAVGRYNKDLQCYEYKEHFAVSPSERGTDSDFERVLYEFTLKDGGSDDRIADITPRRSAKLYTRWTSVHG